MVSESGIAFLVGRHLLKEPKRNLIDGLGTHRELGSLNLSIQVIGRTMDVIDVKVLFDRGE